MTGTEIITAVKNLISVSNTTYDTFILQEINFGQADFSRDINWSFLENRGSVSSVASKYIYDLASDFDTIKSVIFEQNHILVPVNWTQWIKLNQSDSFGTPRYYIIKEGKLQVYPGTDAAASTTTLGAAITSATDTTITLTSVSGIEGKGRALIGSEVIEWQAISGLTIINCRRGLEGTTAATHLIGATFTYRNIEYDYYKTLSDIATGETSVIPTRYHEALVLYSAYKFFEREENDSKANGLLQKYTLLKEQAKKDLGEKQAQTFTTTLEDDTGLGRLDNTYPDDSSLS